MTSGGRRFKRGVRGFTLVEIMLAMLLLGIVISTVCAAWTGTLRIAEEGDYVDEVYAMARNAMTHLSEDMESLAPWGGAFVLEGGPMDQLDESFVDLRFVTSRRLGFSGTRGGFPEVVWFGVEDTKREGEEKSWTLMREERTYQSRVEEGYSDPYDREEAFIVAKNLKSFRCLFIDENSDSHDRWDSVSDLGEQKDRIPRMIVIEMEFHNPDNSERPWRFMTGVTVPRSEGGSK